MAVATKQGHAPDVGGEVIVAVDQLDRLLTALTKAGHQVIGPKVEDGAVIYEPLRSADDLPKGYIDEQDAATYRVVANPSRGKAGDALFAHTVGPHSWKRYLYPPEQKLWSAARKGKSFEIDDRVATPSYALIGVRACELAAIAVQDRVFDNGDFADKAYGERREKAFIVAVNCTRAGGTCFCASMDTGPAVRSGYDLALTELISARRHDFLIAVGSKRGAKILKAVAHRPATAADKRVATQRVKAAEASMGRTMVVGAAKALADNPEHPQWDDVAARCLNCANCTMVCPTCFCTTVEDVTSLDGTSAERWRTWDSCFTVDFSYIHGGPVRRSPRSRYRQWMTHKLSTWHDQFGTSGCTGCGRCITWCPVGIDITAEAKAIAAPSGRRASTKPKTVTTNRQAATNAGGK